MIAKLVQTWLPVCCTTCWTWIWAGAGLPLPLGTPANWPKDLLGDRLRLFRLQLTESIGLKHWASGLKVLVTSLQPSQKCFLILFKAFYTFLTNFEIELKFVIWDYLSTNNSLFTSGLIKSITFHIFILNYDVKIQFLYRWLTNEITITKNQKLLETKLLPSLAIKRFGINVVVKC